MVGGAPWRQRLQFRPLDADQLVAPRIAATNQIGNPVSIGVEVVEVGTAAKHQGLADGTLEVAVLALDCAVLVRQPWVVACRRHLVVLAQRLVATGLVLSDVAVEVAERGGKAVGTVFGRSAPKGPQRVLQPTGQRAEALAPQHGLGMFPAGIGQHEVIQPVRKRFTADADAEVGHVGEVRQALLAGWVVLTEDHLTCWPVLGAPRADAALQCATQAGPVAIRMAQLHLIQQRDRPQAGAAGEQRQDVALPQPAERVDGLPPQRSLGDLLGGQPWIALDPAAGALA